MRREQLELEGISWRSTACRNFWINLASSAVIRTESPAAETAIELPGQELPAELQAALELTPSRRGVTSISTGDSGAEYGAPGTCVDTEEVSDCLDAQ